MKNFLLVFIVLCLQSCIVYHNYHNITTFKHPINASKIRLDGYFVAKVTKYNNPKDIKSRLYTLYYCKSYYYNGTSYYLGAYDDTTTSLSLPFNYIKSQVVDSTQYNNGYTWGRYCITNDTLIEQSFYDSGVPFVFMWKVTEKRYKVINSTTLLGIDELKEGKRTPLNENYHFMENTNYKPSSYNYVNNYLKKYGTKNRYAFLAWVQLWPWW